MSHVSSALDFAARDTDLGALHLSAGASATVRTRERDGNCVFASLCVGCDE